MSDEKELLARLAELPQRQRDILNRMIAVFRSYVPKELREAVDSLLETDQDTKAKCEELEVRPKSMGA